ncbi:hypothetical protein SMU40_04412, partial [Streptococcus mutans 15VF2]
ERDRLKSLIKESEKSFCLRLFLVRAVKTDVVLLKD